ncbi:MAG TPA: protein kinase [Ktedonobacteraceae bacterium]|nr:protein kinase [Ktedonobacteraceae bacterium]
MSGDTPHPVRGLCPLHPLNPHLWGISQTPAQGYALYAPTSLQENAELGDKYMVDDARKNPRLIGGAYQVGQVITHSPMLTTYTAYNRNTSDVVGLLVFDLPPNVEAEAALRLLEPLRRRRLVESPHVIHVFDWGIDGSRVFIATDPPRGISLGTFLDNETLDLKRAVEMAKQMVRGLIALQAHNIENLDMRPQLITVDILLDTDRVQLDDAGLRLLLKQMGYTYDQQFDEIGFFDLRYVSPEFIQGGQIGPWSDVYHVGLLLFEMITGRPPFVGRTSVETRMLQCDGLIPRMIQFRQDTPQVLQDLVDRSLAKEPTQRVRNAAELLDVLEAMPTLQKSMNPSPTPPASALPVVDGVLRTDEISSDPHGEDVALGNIHDAEGGREYAYLCFEEEGGKTRRFAIKDTYVVVGRVDPKRGLKPEVDLTSIDPDMTVSRQHARIRFWKTFFSIEDLKSRNKTRLGELTLTPLKAELLQDGDTLYFGSVRVIFKVLDPG